MLQPPVGGRLRCLPSQWRHRVRVSCAGAALVALSMSCGGGNTPSPGEPEVTAALRIVMETTGHRLDVDGFLVRLDSGASMVIGVNDSVTFDRVQVGIHSLSLADVSRNCDRADGGPLRLDVTAAAGATARAVFRMACGTLVVLDAAHNNYHTLSGRYGPFGEFLRGNGYVVKESASPFSLATLAGVDVLAVANALHADNAIDWSLPTPSAFTSAEIQAVKSWVDAGGSLLLIADHMPFPGAAADLAAAFGVVFENGFAFDTEQLATPKPCLLDPEVQIFRRSDGSLAANSITDGRGPDERVDSVATFTGQAFHVASAGVPFLLFGSTATQWYPDTAWGFLPTTPRMPVSGWSQGSFLESGNGRAAFFGEAAMFSIQTCSGGPGIGQVPMGMNAPRAGQNGQLLLNVVGWLSRDVPQAVLDRVLPFTQALPRDRGGVVPPGRMDGGSDVAPVENALEAIRRLLGREP